MKINYRASKLAAFTFGAALVLSGDRGACALKSGENELVIDESKLLHLKDSNPTVHRYQSDWTYQDFVVDVVSIGSEIRLEYLKAQYETWASHVSVRNFWGFTELQDFDSSCSSQHEEDLADHVNLCKTKGHGYDGTAIKKFVNKFYGFSEGMNDRSNDSKWICAQRRVGRALGWIQHQYSDSLETELPDAVAIVDDDTFLDIDQVKNSLINGKGLNSIPLASAGCLFDRSSSVPFPFAYGGFGTFISKDAVKKLIKPINCETLYDEACSTLQANQIGELDIFEEGMSILDIFYKFSALKNFCMHSDWLIGYMFENYVSPTNNDDHIFETISARETYPSCGNFTLSGSIRPCNIHSGKESCHKIAPKHMEALGLVSYARTPNAFTKRPHLEETSIVDVDEIISESMKALAKKEKELPSHILPNLLLIGAQKSATTSVSEWIFSNGVCSANRFPGEQEYRKKEPHFYGSEFFQGLDRYAQRYEHCIIDDLIMDASPSTLLYADRVYDIYSRLQDEQLSKLRMIVILREPVSRELSLFNHQRSLFMKNPVQDSWYSDVAFNNGTLMDFEQYSALLSKDSTLLKHWQTTGYYIDHLQKWISLFSREKLLVLSYKEVTENPSMIQWRIQKFLGKTFDGSLGHANNKSYKGKVTDVPATSRQLLEPLFHKKNNALYDFLDNSSTRPWMEQYPFPHFDTSNEENEKKKFAYVTVLGSNPDKKQEQLYLDAARVLIQSLKELGTDADIVVLMMFHDPEAEHLLSLDGAIVKHINPLEQTRKVEDFEPWFADIALAKLRAFELTEYERVQLLDSDVLVEQNLDALFLYYQESKLVSEGLGGDSPLRAGWMMLKPSSDDFQELQAIVTRGKFDTHTGWDYLSLIVAYPGWSRKKQTGNEWGFYGAQLEQGLLYFYFYALPKWSDPSAKTINLLTLLDDQELKSHGFTHFYGSRKPWLDKITVNYEAADRWRQIRSTLELPMDPLSKFNLPLTEVGHQHYLKERVLYLYDPEFEVKVHGGLSVSAPVCNLGETELTSLTKGVEDSIDSQVPQGKATVTSVCGQSTIDAPSRRLQSSNSWDIGYSIVVSNVLCGSIGCSDTGDINLVNAIIQDISEAVEASVQSGDFVSILASNTDIQAALASDPQAIGCLVAWGAVFSTTSGTPITNTTSTNNNFYPDWRGQSGTCLNDGEEPLYMALNPNMWLYSSLEACCSRYYPGWNEPQCLQSRGTGLWYVDYLKLKCVTDCGTDGGPTCGGLAPPNLDDLYANPRECCKAHLQWLYVEFCEAESLINECYVGTGKFYRGQGADEVCVRDCEESSDPTCGGIVDADWVELHDDASACCTAEFSWIDNDLCTARSKGSATEKYWPDQINSRCIKDSVSQPEDLSVPLFDSAEACCKERVSWVLFEKCVAEADGGSFSYTGTDKYYVKSGKCVKDCEAGSGTDCGGFAAQWDPRSDSKTACCKERLWWDELSNCLA